MDSNHNKPQNLNANTDDNAVPSNSILLDNASHEYAHTQVSGAINQHTPSYWRLALPALGARYVMRYFTKFGNTSERAFDAMAGTWMMFVTGFFALRTERDMHSLFSEVLAYEFDKKREDVNIWDFLNSKNPMVEVAKNNFVKYNGLRIAVNGLFFTSFAPGESKLAKILREEPSVDLGVGANNMYLVSEILGRSRTFFENLQSLVDSKLSTKNSLGEPVQAQDLMRLYQSNAADNDKENVMDAKTHPEVIKNSRKLFERMAELMNTTYLNKQYGEENNFTLPKFLYLLGFNLIQPKDIKKSMVYVEVANTYGIGVLKDVVQEVKDGTNIDQIIDKYHVNMSAMNELLVGETDKKPAAVRTNLPNHQASFASRFVPQAKMGADFVGRIQDNQNGSLLAT